MIVYASNKIFHFSQLSVFIAYHLSKINLHSGRKKWFYLAQNILLFISKIFDVSEKRVP